MRKLLVLVLVGGFWGGLFDPTVARASAYCQVTCPSGLVLSCCTSTGTCTSTPGSSINCNGTIMNCGPASAYDDCLSECRERWYSCMNSCEFTCGICDSKLAICENRCGEPVPSSIGC